MSVVTNTDAAAAPKGRRAIAGDLAGVAAILLIAAIGYLVFPNNLALLTRVVAIALLVLSLDLVTGYGGIATAHGPAEHHH